MNKWTSVNERMPEENVDVLVTDGLDVWSDCWASGEWSIDPEADVTHWMNMPEAPEREKPRPVLAVYEVEDEDGDVTQILEVSKTAEKDTVTRALLSVIVAGSTDKKLRKYMVKAISVFLENVKRPDFVTKEEGFRA